MSLDQKKIIEFNSDIFSGSKKTRKKREVKKVKPIISPSLTKNKLLKQFRDKQNEKNGEFEESMSFLDSLSKIKSDETEDVKLDYPEQLELVPYDPEPEPAYGCLKNGIKPTFKELSGSITDPNKVPVFRIMEPTKNTIELTKKEEELSTSIKENTVKITKNKKYTLGKSKLYKKIGILIKDKQTRKNIINAQKDLKSVPILEIKNQLKKKGLIKAGSTASSDLLRTMYENSVMAGDIMNTNKEILLHNFTNTE